MQTYWIEKWLIKYIFGFFWCIWLEEWPLLLRLFLYIEKLFSVFCLLFRDSLFFAALIFLFKTKFACLVRAMHTKKWKYTNTSINANFLYKNNIKNKKYSKINFYNNVFVRVCWLGSHKKENFFQEKEEHWSQTVRLLLRWLNFTFFPFPCLLIRVTGYFRLQSLSYFES